jgi:hypothetical protein
VDRTRADTVARLEQATADTWAHGLAENSFLGTHFIEEREQVPAPDCKYFQASLHLVSLTPAPSFFHSLGLQDTIGEFERRSIRCEPGRWEDQPPSTVPL